MDYLNFRLLEEIEDRLRHEKVPEESIRKTLDVLEKVCSRDAWPFIDGNWLRTQERMWVEYSERLLSSQQARMEEALDQAAAGLDERLAEIRIEIARSRMVCRYEQPAPDYEIQEYVSVLRSPDGAIIRSARGTINADPASFMNRLATQAAKGRVLVLVDPYALSDKNEAGASGNSVEAIKTLFQAATSTEKLHLYCREDAVSLKVWQRLESQLGAHKLEVHLGDLHDRYLLAGSDQQGKDRHLTDKPWHGYQRWVGVVFGASLNGVAKRPTYVLKCEQGDLNAVLEYIESQTQVKRLADVQAAWRRREEDEKNVLDVGVEQRQPGGEGLGQDQ